MIHPADPTTQFLDEVYIGLDCEVVRSKQDYSWLKKKVDQYETVYLLGHGLPQGLFGPDMKLMVDDRLADSLRNKQLVGVFCNADRYFHDHGLAGLYTGMIVSSSAEAYCFNLPADLAMVEASNRAFAKSLRGALDVHDPADAGPEAADRYRNSILVENPIIEFNFGNIHSRIRKETNRICASHNGGHKHARS